MRRPPKTKKDQLALALACYPVVPALGPAPAIPGGWGLRNPKPKGPSQRSIFFSQFRAAGGWRKWGGIMIPANDPVTVFGGDFRRKLRPNRPLRCAPVGAIMSLT